MTWFIILLILGVAIFVVLRSRRPKNLEVASLPSLARTSPEPESQPLPKTTFPEVRISYEDASGDVTERTITPIHRLGTRVIKAYCHLRNDERTFRFDRIRAIYKINTSEPLDKYTWMDSLPSVESQGSRNESPLEDTIRIAVATHPEGSHVTFKQSTKPPVATNFTKQSEPDDYWPSDSVHGMAPKPGSFDASLFIDPKTGRFQFPKYQTNTNYLARIEDTTDYQETFWNHLDRQDKREYDLDRFNWDIESGGLSIEAEGFTEFLREENRRYFPQFDTLFSLDLEVLLNAIDINAEASGLDILWLSPSDLAYKAVRDGYLDLAKADESIDCWQRMKVSEIRKICTTAEIKLGNKTKDELVKELVKKHVPLPNDAVLPYRPSSRCRESLDMAIATYIAAVKENADRFHPTYIAYIWDAVIDGNSHTYVSRAIRNAISDRYWLARMQPAAH
jgi:hypothetical protein